MPIRSFQARHFQMGVSHVHITVIFIRSYKAFYDVTWTSGSFGARLYVRLAETTSLMPKTKKNLACLFVERIHPVFASVRGRPAAVAERKDRSAANRKKARKTDKKAMCVQEWLSEDRKQQLDHYQTPVSREFSIEIVNAFQNHLRRKSIISPFSSTEKLNEST